MDDDGVRAGARAFADALVAGAVDQAIESFSPELKRNLGEIISMFPLPASEAAIQSVEHAGAGFNVVIRLVGESEENEILTRWKVRDGEPTIVEVSHLSRVDRAGEAEADAETEDDGETA